MAALYPRECTLRVEMRPVQCILFAEGDFVTIRGQVVKSRQVEEEEGEPPHDYYEIILEKPLCERAADSAWPMFYTQVVNVKPKMLGHWVEVSGTMEGVEAGYNIDQKSIREVRD